MMGSTCNLGSNHGPSGGPALPSVRRVLAITNASNSGMEAPSEEMPVLLLSLVTLKIKEGKTRFYNSKLTGSFPIKSRGPGRGLA